MRKGSSLMSLDPCSPGNPSLPGATEVPGREDDLWAAVRKAAADREGDAHEPRRWDGWMTEVTTRPLRRDTSPHRGARHGGG